MTKLGKSHVNPIFSASKKVKKNKAQVKKDHQIFEH